MDFSFIVGQSITHDLNLQSVLGGLNCKSKTFVCWKNKLVLLLLLSYLQLKKKTKNRRLLEVFSSKTRGAESFNSVSPLFNARVL